MTSTVTATARADADLVSVLQALFPSGSVTGAPKVRSTQIIRELEPFPRGIYTGAVGLLSPTGDAVFNVAIRTLAVEAQSRRATLGVGGGITWGSTVEKEYDESLLKASFLGALARVLVAHARAVAWRLQAARALPGADSARYVGFRFNEGMPGEHSEFVRSTLKANGECDADRSGRKDAR